jgi:DNA-binding phage protein
MKLKTTPVDPADFLDTKESQIELLADAIETGDSRYIANALGTIARARDGEGRARGRDNAAGALSFFERER